MTPLRAAWPAVALVLAFGLAACEPRQPPKPKTVAGVAAVLPAAA
jgi:hypothetical protein